MVGVGGSGGDPLLRLPPVVASSEGIAAMSRRSDEPGAALAIGLGANLPTACGGPLDTLIAVRPRLSALFERWAGPACPLGWSPLFRTAPVGGPPDQPDYINAAVLVVPPLIPSAAKAMELLAGLQQLELNASGQHPDS